MPTVGAVGAVDAFAIVGTRNARLEAFAVLLETLGFLAVAPFVMLGHATA